MVTLGLQAREQLGKLGLSADALSARLGELEPARLKQLGRLRTLDAQAAVSANRFAQGLRDGRVQIPKAFSNPAPRAARAALAPLVGETYATMEAARHPSEREPLRHLLHPRRSRPARMTLAVARRPELRARVGTAVGALVANDGRTDGVLSVERAPRAQRSSASSSPARGPSLPPPTQSFGSGTIWEIMMAMDQAILQEAAALGLGQGSGPNGTVGMMEAMGLWSLAPDDGDPSQWMGFGQGTSARAQGMTGVPQPQSGPTGTAGPESQNSGLDVQIMRVKRMIDKKSQMMELYSQSLSKYNSSANAIIGNMKG